MFGIRTQVPRSRLLRVDRSSSENSVMPLCCVRRIQLYDSATALCQTQHMNVHRNPVMISRLCSGLWKMSGSPFDRQGQVPVSGPREPGELVGPKPRSAYSICVEPCTKVPSGPLRLPWWMHGTPKVPAPCGGSTRPCITPCRSQALRENRSLHPCGRSIRTYNPLAEMNL